MLGFALTGSYCTISEAIKLMEKLIAKGYDILPIMSENAFSVDTRFGNACEIREKIEKITGKKVIHTIVGAEPLGPKIKLDALIICPCTGNTLAKIANGITDTCVCMAAKAHLRNDKPLVLALATNDALSGNLKNIGALMSRKNIYFVPMRQDDPESKPHSLVANFEMLEESLLLAMQGRQSHKIFI